MAFMIRAAHVLQCGVQRDANPRGEQTSKSVAQFGLQAATRLHEAGIASNRGSAYRGECVPEPCNTPPVKPRKLGGPEVTELTRKGGRSEGQLDNWD